MDAADCDETKHEKADEHSSSSSGVYPDGHASSSDREDKVEHVTTELNTTDIGAHRRNETISGLISPNE